MIQIEAIHVEDFRGIRRLDLQLECKSFVVWGPNGSGKSGVVDAIGFALTGSIARLSGAGTGTVSLLKHGPHVHERDNAGAAKVALKIRDTASGHTGVLTRCVKTAAAFTLNPDTPQLRAAVERARQHPELTLTRREIIKFILAEPGTRATEIQALLKLDRIDQVRKLLVTSRNKAATRADGAAAEVAASGEALSRHLGLNVLSASGVRHETNQRRAILGLDPLDKVLADTDLRAGMNGGAGGPAFSKESAIRDVQALAGGVANPARLMEAAEHLAAAFEELSADPTILSALRHRNLVTVGLGLLTEATCPLCDWQWADIAALHAHLQEKLLRSEAAADLERRILASSQEVRVELLTFTSLIEGAQPWAAADCTGELPHLLRSWVLDLTELSGAYRASMEP